MKASDLRASDLKALARWKLKSDVKRRFEDLVTSSGEKKDGEKGRKKGWGKREKKRQRRKKKGEGEKKTAGKNGHEFTDERKPTEIGK